MRQQDTRVRLDDSRRGRLACADAVRCACFRNAAAAADSGRQTISTCSSSTTLSLVPSGASRRTARCSTRRLRARSAPSACLTSASPHRRPASVIDRATTHTLCSNVKHLEEIRAKGWSMPAVNQVEVRLAPSQGNTMLIIIRSNIQLHPLCQQRPIVEYCAAHGIVVQAYCPIIRGRMDAPAIQAAAAKVRPYPLVHAGAMLTAADSTRATPRRSSSAGRSSAGASFTLLPDRSRAINFSSHATDLCPSRRAQRLLASTRTRRCSISCSTRTTWLLLTRSIRARRVGLVGTLSTPIEDPHPNVWTSALAMDLLFPIVSERANQRTQRH